MYKLKKYGAPWCKPCRQLDDLLNSLNIEYEDVDIDKNTEEAVKKGLVAIPVLEFYNENGEVVKSHTGAIGKTHLLKLLNDA